MARRRRIEDRLLIVPGEKVQGHHTYTIGEVVGSGAYACVYRATDELGRIVALKEYYPPSHPRETEGLKNLVERERFILTQVSTHPQIPTFYEGFVVDNQYYLAQEFVEGRSLDEVIRQDKSIPAEMMLKWAIELCDALSYLHGHQIVHHDLKPPNLRITPTNHLKLLDYGAAIYLGEADANIPDSVQQETELFGTEGYLPPEVEETFKADIRTDIFALGCILYEMVMGEPPEQQSLSERNLYVTTPLMQRKDVDLSFVKLVTTALSYNTEFRYANAGMFATELKKISQAMLFVSTKSVYFGTVNVGSTTTQKFKIYNGGGKGELVGEIRPKCPWLHVEVPGFRTQKRDVVLIADANKVQRRNELVRGQVEIVTKDVVDGDGQMLARADRLVVDCYITAHAKDAQLVVTEIPDPSTPLAVHVRQGAIARITFTLQNIGQLPAEGALIPTDPDSGIIAGPDMFRLQPDDSVSIVAVIPPTSSNTPGSRRTVTIDAVVDDQPVLTIPIEVEVESLFPYVKGVLKRAMFKKIA